MQSDSSYLPTGCLSFFLTGYFRLQFFPKIVFLLLVHNWDTLSARNYWKQFLSIFQFLQRHLFLFLMVTLLFTFLSYRQNFFNFLFILWEFQTENFYHIPSSHPTPPRYFPIPTQSTSSFSLKKKSPKKTWNPVYVGHCFSVWDLSWSMVDVTSVMLLINHIFPLLASYYLHIAWLGWNLWPHPIWCAQVLSGLKLCRSCECCRVFLNSSLSLSWCVSRILFPQNYPSLLDLTIFLLTFRQRSLSL